MSNSSRTRKGIRHDIKDTGERIVCLCDEIDELQADIYCYQDDGDICDGEECRYSIGKKMTRLIKAINRMNKLGSELREVAER